jgi:hypothetical protein
MNALSRRRSPHRAHCWHVYYEDVCVGWIGLRAGVPVDVDQWGWNCGFYPVSHRGQSADGTAPSFKAARSNFAAAWRALLPTLTEADFTEYRRQRARTAWMYAMWDTGHKLPIQRLDLRSRCLCGEAIDSRSTEQHICCPTIGARRSRLILHGGDLEGRQRRLPQGKILLGVRNTVAKLG